MPRYACPCVRVTAQQVRSAEGASVDALGRELGVCRTCGSCAPTLVGILAGEAHVEERRSCKAEAAGSSPVTGSTVQ
jgi:bacterioferritin-associated ferredoxin